jgi:uncharacterized protein (TIGR02231 family)
MKLLAFLEDQRARLATERQSLDAQLEDLGAKRTAAERQLNEIRGAGGRSYKTVTVRLDAATAGQLDLAVSYAVPGASWRPSYDARVNSGDRAVALSYFGVIRQNTGEDWKNVTVTLSTARPNLGGAAPEITPWGLDVVMPVPMRRMAKAANEEDEKHSDRLNQPAQAASGAIQLSPFEVRTDKDVGFAAAALETGATSATFKLVGTATIPSDNSPQKVPIAASSLAATPEYLTVPKQLAAAFLTEKVVNHSDFPLLAGAMNVFLDGTFVATSALRTVMPGEKFDLALGADEGISVKHKRVNKFTEDTGLTNSGRRITYEYLLTIQNNKKTAERVIVTDQVPLSRNEKIVVKLYSPTEREVKPANDGALKWTLDLKPTEKREITVKFSIDYPNEILVAGLN